GVRVDEGTGAHARHQPGARGELADAGPDALVAEHRARAASAGPHDDVRWRRRLPGVVGEDSQTLRTANRAVRVGDGVDGDAVVGPAVRPRGEHLPWPGPVELLRVFEQNDGDVHAPLSGTA